MNKDTLKESGYEVVSWEDETTVILEYQGDGKLERWVENDGHASYGININGKDFEFVSEINGIEAINLIKELDSVK